MVFYACDLLTNKVSVAINLAKNLSMGGESCV